MASLQPYPNGIFHVHFRFAGQRFNRSLKTRSAVEAESRVARLRETLRLVEAGRIEVPLDEDHFVKFGGTISNYCLIGL